MVIHSPGKHCQFAVVTNVARPDVDTTEPVCYELVCLLFEPTSSFGSKFPFNSTRNLVSLWARWFTWCEVNLINFCFSQCLWEIFGCHWTTCINFNGEHNMQSENGIWLGGRVHIYSSKLWSP